MRVRDMGLAALTSVIWGFAFVTYKFGLESFSAPQLTALRFMVACLPVLFVPRPKLPWSAIVLIGLTLFAGQFLLLFFAFALDMPAGLASVAQQTQAFFTVLAAAVVLHEIPQLPHCGGLGRALAGPGAVGNILVKRTAGVPVFPLMAWCSLVAPLPVLLLSWLVDPQPSLISAVLN